VSFVILIIRPGSFLFKKTPESELLVPKKSRDYEQTLTKYYEQTHAGGRSSHHISLVVFLKRKSDKKSGRLYQVCFFFLWKIFLQVFWYTLISISTNKSVMLNEVKYLIDYTIRSFGPDPCRD